MGTGRVKRRVEKEKRVEERKQKKTLSERIANRSTNFIIKSKKLRYIQ